MPSYGHNAVNFNCYPDGYCNLVVDPPMNKCPQSCVKLYLNWNWNWTELTRLYYSKRNY